MIENWRTSICGLLVLAGAIYLFSTNHPVEGGTLLAAGLGLLGAADYTKK